MTKEFTLYYNNSRENPKDIKYPKSMRISSVSDLEVVVSKDHVCAEYIDNQRSNANFIKTDCTMLDIDNTGSDNPDDWISPDDLCSKFPKVPFYVSYSRNHNKVKNGKAARPKFHVYFPDRVFENAEEYKKHKENVCNYFSAFDKNAKDVARFFYGVKKPKVEYFDGDVLLYDFMKTVKQEKPHDDKENTASKYITEGNRNNTMYVYALNAIERYSNEDKAYKDFILESERCYPPLSQQELSSIWKSALKRKQNEQNQFELPVVDGKAIKQLCSLNVKNRKFDISTARLFLKAFGITIRLNDMSRNIEVSGLQQKYNQEDACNILETLIADSASKLSYKRLNGNIVHDVLSLIANENHYHPVIELLNSEKWDGKDRLNEIYNILGIKNNFYKTLVRKWALQTIALLYNSPAHTIFSEGVLVLQGEQGVGKTQFFRHLAIKNSFFKGGATLDMSNKDTLMSATKVWICELGEIDSTTKKEQSSLKAYLTESTDRYREPYARCETITPRRTSFCGTVNPKAYLRDETGNRRYWTIPVEKIDIEKIFKYTPEWYAQFWRQIHCEYEKNHKGYILTSEEQQQVNNQNKEFEVDLLGEDEFMTMYDLNAKKTDWKYRTAAQIANELNSSYRSLNIKSVQIGKQLLPRIEKKTGITFERKKSNGKKLILCPPRCFAVLHNTIKTEENLYEDNEENIEF